MVNRVLLELMRTGTPSYHTATTYVCTNRMKKPRNLTKWWMKFFVGDGVLVSTAPGIRAGFQNCHESL